MTDTVKYLSPLISCMECRKEYSAKGIFKHLLNTHDKISSRDIGKGTQKFIKKCFCIICHIETTVQSLNEHYNRHKKEMSLIEKTCPKCSSAHGKPGIFCCRKCANSRIFSKESNSKRTLTLKNKLKKESTKKYTKISQCSICNKSFEGSRKTCSQECLKIALNRGASKGGKKSASKQIRRSKDEIILYDLCASHYSNVTHNDPIFNGWDADIIIHDIKTAILWNGPWHYKEMGIRNHSLSQVQNRDKIKIKEILSLGWNVLIFEDRQYTPLSAFNFILDNLSDAGTGNAPISDQAYETCRVT
jgi:predicted nucleic acid-binding Zn ribbon protein